MIRTICLGLLAAAVTVPATAQVKPRVLPVSADAPFVHANSGATLPVRLIDLPRTQVREFEGPELDVVATYTDDRSELTVYVYRTLSGAVPVWFDRATSAIESRDGWGTLTPVAAAPIAVAPPGRSIASGLAQGWGITDGPYRGTAIAMVPLGEWLVKLRYSSKAADGPQAFAAVRAALAALAWPASAKDAAPAAPVAACPKALQFKGQAKAMAPDLNATMMGALLAMPVETAKREGPAPVWCRDAARVQMGALYRPDAQDNGYLLALSDAGRGIWVGPSLDGLFDNRKKTAWSVDFITPGRTIVFPQQDRLPSPERVIGVASGTPASVVTTWGQKRDISITPDALKSKK